MTSIEAAPRGGAWAAPESTVSRVRRLHEAVRCALPQRHAIAAILILVLGVAGFSAFEPLILKWVFDELTAQRQASIILTGIIALLGFALARELMDGFATWLSWRTHAAPAAA